MKENKIMREREKVRKKYRKTDRKREPEIMRKSEKVRKEGMMKLILDNLAGKGDKRYCRECEN